MTYCIESDLYLAPEGTRVSWVPDWDGEGDEPERTEGLLIGNGAYASYDVQTDDGEVHRVLDSWEVSYSLEEEQVRDLLEYLPHMSAVAVEDWSIWSSGSSEWSMVRDECAWRDEQTPPYSGRLPVYTFGDLGDVIDLLNEKTECVSEEIGYELETFPDCLVVARWDNVVLTWEPSTNEVALMACDGYGSLETDTLPVHFHIGPPTLEFLRMQAERIFQAVASARRKGLSLFWRGEPYTSYDAPAIVLGHEQTVAAGDLVLVCEKDFPERRVLLWTELGFFETGRIRKDRVPIDLPRATVYALNSDFILIGDDRFRVHSGLLNSRAGSLFTTHLPLRVLEPEVEALYQRNRKS